MSITGQEEWEERLSAQGTGRERRRSVDEKYWMVPDSSEELKRCPSSTMSSEYPGLNRRYREREREKAKLEVL